MQLILFQLMIHLTFVAYDSHFTHVRWRSDLSGAGVHEHRLTSLFRFRRIRGSLSCQGHYGALNVLVH